VTARRERMAELVARLQDEGERRSVQESLDLMTELEALLRAEFLQGLRQAPWWRRWWLRRGYRMARRRLG
jgi:hypothetical protein